MGPFSKGMKKPQAECRYYINALIHTGILKDSLECY